MFCFASQMSYGDFINGGGCKAFFDFRVKMVHVLQCKPLAKQTQGMQFFFLLCYRLRNPIADAGFIAHGKIIVWNCHRADAGKADAGVLRHITKRGRRKKVLIFS